jgi:hypothetical protein
MLAIETTARKQLFAARNVTIFCLTVNFLFQNEHSNFFAKRNMFFETPHSWEFSHQNSPQISGAWSIVSAVALGVA